MDESPATAPRRGRVLRGDGFRLEHRNSVSVGSDGGCDVVVEGADPRHAELRWDPDRGAWFLRDDPAPGKTYLNADPIADGRLFEGDVIGIAGVKLLFAGKRLRELKPDEVRSRPSSVRAAAESRRSSSAWPGFPWTARSAGTSFSAASASFPEIRGFCVPSPTFRSRWRIRCIPVFPSGKPWRISGVAISPPAPIRISPPRWTPSR